MPAGRPPELGHLGAAPAARLEDHLHGVAFVNQRAGVVLQSTVDKGPHALNLTVRNRRERAVERTRADFVANASHELRTPLAALSGFAGTVCGDQTYYWIGRRWGRPLMHRFPRLEARCQPAFDFLRKYDNWFILGFRFVYGVRNGKGSYRVTAFCTTAVRDSKEGYDYSYLMKEILVFFKTRKAPVPLAETVEIMAFMEAADESKRRGGAPVSIADVMKAAGAK